MENVSLNMDGYFRRLKRSLNCPKSVRKPFLDRTRQMAEDFILENPTATSQNVADFLGDPRELAQGFLETLDHDMLERYLRRKKLFRRGCVAVLVVALATSIVWGLRLWNTQSIEIIETTTVIYHD